jgi:NTE family protein
VNWGYAICDAGLRRHLDRDAARPLGFPYREAAV